MVDEAGLPVGLLISCANQSDSKAAESLVRQLAARMAHRPWLLLNAVYPHTFVNWAVHTLAWPLELWDYHQRKVGEGKNNMAVLNAVHNKLIGRA